ncbi:MAG: hypothetical protein KatS3mg076_0664 [Candidatus Binatia bacterium]|nr:MAG: hypothetical protein KatS3mg076_0664 [Candidatus Binatia bacterium]
MKRLAATFTLLGCAVLFAGCGDDGGVGGTGLSPAVVRGNVAAEVEPNEAAREAEPLSGILVRVEGREEIRDVTDRAGRFRLEGEFPQPTAVLEFREPNGFLSRLEVVVPAGGEVELTNVRLRVPDPLAGMKAEPESVLVDFEGFVEDTEPCEDGHATILVGHPAVDFPVEVTPETILTDERTGMPLGCEALSTGLNVRVRGALDRTGTVHAERVRVLRRTERPRLFRGAPPDQADG